MRTYEMNCNDFAYLVHRYFEGITRVTPRMFESGVEQVAKKHNVPETELAEFRKAAFEKVQRKLVKE